jgi:hypothetical protein
MLELAWQCARPRLREAGNGGCGRQSERSRGSSGSEAFLEADKKAEVEAGEKASCRDAIAYMPGRST